MKKIIGFSLACAAALYATEATLQPLTVESTTLSDVSGEEVKSADLAEALSTKVPSINLIRRSGIANDILLRGQKRDNINVTIDGTKIYGACPNRMDPPTSHVVVHNIEGVEIIEGPYNVEDFGTLSGDVKVTTKEPTAQNEGEVSVNFGSFGYKKVSGTLSGGNDRVQLMVVGSMEESDQYEDGNGDTLAEQTDKNAPMMGPKYTPAYHDMKAFEKQSVMGKVNVNVTDDQQLKLSYTTNESEDILYPSTGMDALSDDAQIYNAEYIVKNIGAYSKNLSLQAYHSEVDHPMSNEYRYAGASVVTVNHLTTEMEGLKIKNSFDLADTAVTIGLDASNRNWDGHYEINGTVGPKSINDADTENRALFVEASRAFGGLDLKAGVRYDNTEITSAGTTTTNEYNNVSGNLYATYQAGKSTKIFGGAGTAIRVPDARELYFFQGGKSIGTDGLNETKNYEVDLGVEQTYEHASVKVKTFYSKLKDYIYYIGDAGLDGMGNDRFDNIDATIYGAELSGSWYPIDALALDFGMAYLKGKKDDVPAGHTTDNLADIQPLKANAAVSYYYSGENYAKIEVLSAQGWNDFDSDSGEQEIAGYGVVNLKVSHDIDRSWNLTAGVDNVLDKAYAVSNTYKDLKLLSTGTDVMLLNEPGRYYYVNASYRF
jgi:iron complex outermembrane receptor protein